MTTRRRLKSVIAFLCTVTAFAAIVLATVAQLEFWRSADAGWPALSGLVLGVLSRVAAGCAFDAGRLGAGLCTVLLGTVLAVFCGTVLVWAVWLTYFGGRHVEGVHLAGCLAMVVYFRGLEGVFKELDDGRTFLRD